MVEEEHRHFSRVPFEMKVTVEREGDRFQVELINLSLKGMLLRFTQHHPFTIGDWCRIELDLLDSGLLLEFKGEMVHCAGNEAGFKFVQMDVDTMTHLRKIIELNLGDGDHVSEELSFFVKP